MWLDDLGGGADAVVTFVIAGGVAQSGLVAPVGQRAGGVGPGGVGGLADLHAEPIPGGVHQPREHGVQVVDVVAGTAGVGAGTLTRKR